MTSWIQDEANRILAARRRRRRARPVRARAGRGAAPRLRGIYVGDLGAVIDMEAIAGSGLHLGVDPLGGASVALLGGDRRALRPRPDGHEPAGRPAFGFMTVDWDGKIRMDPSSPYAMAGLVELRDRFDLAIGNDADADRHGIVDAGRRAAEPEPLPGGRGRLPVRRRPRLGPPRWRSARRSCRPR